MKVTVQQTGGYVGFTKLQVDDQDLDGKDKVAFSKLVDQGLLFARQKQNLLPPGNMPKSRLIIETDKGIQEFTFDILQMPAEVDALVEFVQTHGKPVKLSK